MYLLGVLLFPGAQLAKKKRTHYPQESEDKETRLVEKATDINPHSFNIWKTGLKRGTQCENLSHLHAQLLNAPVTKKMRSLTSPFRMAIH